MKKKTLIGAHLLIVILAATSWLWVDYRVLAIVALAQFVVTGITHGCPLTHAQFTDDQDALFTEWWLAKLGVKFTTAKGKKALYRVMRYVVPVVFILLAVLLQMVFGLEPLLRWPW